MQVINMWQVLIGRVLNASALVASSPAEETIVTNVAAGIVSGALSSAIANPTDVLKVKDGLS